jgi:putative membrane-bound dehydrogenase-like protein
MKIRSLLPFACLWLSIPTSAQTRFPAIHNSEPGDPEPMPAAEALKKLQLPEGFQATIFSSEPNVQNPIAAAWDSGGRLWIAENYTYAERQKRFDLTMNDRVVVFEDKDNDGIAESRKIFTDQVQMLTSIEVGLGGVWLMCPPKLLFIPDANGDDIPDGPPQEILDGFEVSKDNYHNFANGLRWGPDGWLYGRCGHSCPAKPGIPGTPENERPAMKGGFWRYHPRKKTVEVLTQGTVNSWGHDWDRHGEGFFINTVIGHLWHIIPGADFKEVGTAPSTNPEIYERIDMIADHYHFDTKGKWQDSRDGAANDFGGGHAHIGAMIYQADQWPEPYRNKLFTLNMHGRRVNVERLDRSGSGFSGKHEPDVFFSADPWFRGIEITQGPDGSAFILDWSDTGECHDLTGVHRTSGRVYKISYGIPKMPDFSDLKNITPDGVERIIRTPNVWWERRLRVKLMEQPSNKPVTDRLREIATNPANESVHRLRAIWTLEATGQLDRFTRNSLLNEADENLRAWGVRLFADQLAQLNILSTHEIPEIAALENLARKDASGLVKLHLASTLRHLPPSVRSSLALPLASDPSFAHDPQLPHLIWYGMIPVAEENPRSLIDLAVAAKSPKLVKWIARYLATRQEKSPAPFDDLLAAAIPEETRPAILEGINEAFAGISKANAPANWKAFAASISDPRSQRLVQKLSLLFGDASTLDLLKKTVADPQSKTGDRQAALDILIDAKVPGLRTLCESVLDTPKLNGNALRGLALSDDPAIAKTLVANFGKFEAVSQGHLIDLLTGRPAWADILLDEIASGRIPRTALPAFSARRIVALENGPLTEKLTEIWGSINSSAGDKSKAIADLKKKLTPEVLAKADLRNGKLLYSGICGACHTLYGQGGNLGPDLTGSGRSNIDYLLENIIDPSAVVTADYRITTLTLNDGRILSGTIGAQTARTLTLKSPAGDTTVELSAVEKQESTTNSLMPEGLLTAFQPDQARDLIAYLMHDGQVR